MFKVIPKDHDVSGNAIEMNQPFLLVIILAFRSNFKKM